LDGRAARNKGIAHGGALRLFAAAKFPNIEALLLRLPGVRNGSSAPRTNSVVLPSSSFMGIGWSF
jgi:hypothetical protein